MSTIDIRDKVNIYASQTLSIDDYASLSLLYQPLIKSKALGIYQTLYSLLDRSSLSADGMIFSNVLDLIGSTQDEFEEARLSLEGIGLLETFNKKDIYVFLIKPPLSPARFLQDTVFGTYLLSAVGEQMFNVLVSKFRIEKFDRLGYDNITASFDEVYESIDDAKVNVNGFILGRKNNSSVNINNHNFDFDLFESNIDETLLENGLTPQIKRLVINTSYVYGFDENTLVMLFNQSINKNGYFDQKLLIKKAALLNKHDSLGQAPMLDIKKTVNSEEEEVMNSIANTSVKEILSYLWPNSPDTYLKTISEIYDSISYLDRSVLNILVFFVLKAKDGVMPTASYFKKVAEGWYKEGINTKEAAWAKARSLRSGSGNNPSLSPKNVKGNIKSNEYSREFTQNGIKMEEL